MMFKTVKETADSWGISERSVRNYCAAGRVPGAVRDGNTWAIPEDAVKPERLNKRQDLPDTLPERLQLEKDMKLPGGIYHRVQIDMTYNSNHMEGSTLTHDQTRYIFETNTVGVDTAGISVDDIVETANHFLCIDLIIDYYNYPLSESFIKELHRTLKSGTTDSRQSWFAVGDYKKVANEVGGKETTLPAEVPSAMRSLLTRYRGKKTITWDDLLSFHYDFEAIHPFQDGNGRIGRLLLFKECLRAGITPFIVPDDQKLLYYNGLAKWSESHGYLDAACRLFQDDFKAVLDYFQISHE